MNTGMSRHILRTFDEALESLRAQVLTMAELTQRIIRYAKRGLFERDDVFCTAAIADDADIDQLEKDVDQAGVSILLHYQPVATDLRNVISAMKVSSNLERVGDQSVTIARRARKLNAQPELDDVILLRPMFETSCKLLDDSLRAYREQNAILARGLRERDREVNAAEATLDNEIVRRIPGVPDRVECYLDFTFIARCLERVGDHAVNIGEDTVYVIEAEDIRH